MLPVRLGLVEALRDTSLGVEGVGVGVGGVDFWGIAGH